MTDKIFLVDKQIKLYCFHMQIKEHTKFGILIIFDIVFVIVSLYMIFFYAPVEEIMGEVQKIFYYHVASAINIYIGITISLISTILYLFKHNLKFDLLSWAGIETAFLWGIIVLVTGPLWAKATWGFYWTWDPRLTTVTILMFLLFTYILVRYSTKNHKNGSTICSIITILTAINSVFIHKAVSLWRGQHPTVIYRPHGIPAEMKITLIISIITIALWSITFIIIRWKSLILENEYKELKISYQIYKGDK